MSHEIVNIRRMTDDELEREGWHNGRHANPPVLELANGDVLFPSMDPEGNGPGAMFGRNSDGEAFFLSP